MLIRLSVISTSKKAEPQARLPEVLLFVLRIITIYCDPRQYCCRNEQS